MIGKDGGSYTLYRAHLSFLFWFDRSSSKDAAKFTNRGLTHGSSPPFVVWQRRQQRVAMMSRLRRLISSNKDTAKFADRGFVHVGSPPF